jgi:hypothetical protein
MPVNLSARALLWIGISLLLASALAQVVIDFVYRYAGADILQSTVDSWWFGALVVARGLFVPLGPLMIAAFFVAHLMERDPAAAATATVRVTAAWVFTAGLVLTLLGVLIYAYLDGWLATLNSQGRTSLALDALNLVVVPLRTLVLPLGLALLPASVLMKKLEARSPVETPAHQPTS